MAPRKDDRGPARGKKEYRDYDDRRYDDNRDDLYFDDDGFDPDRKLTYIEEIEDAERVKKRRFIIGSVLAVILVALLTILIIVISRFGFIFEFLGSRGGHGEQDQSDAAGGSSQGVAASTTVPTTTSVQQTTSTLQVTTPSLAPGETGINNMHISTPPSESSAPEPVAESKAPPQNYSGTYTLKEGDTLWKIVHELYPDSNPDEKMQQIAELNGYSSAADVTDLHAGDTIYLP